MDAPDGMVEAVAEALFHRWYGAEWSDVQANPIVDQYRDRARIVLSVPALAEVIARDTKVREIAPDAVWLAKLARSGSWPGGMAQAVENAVSRVIRTLGTDDDRAAQEAVTAALYPEAGKATS